MRYSIFITLTLITLGVPFLSDAQPQKPEPVKLIFDTDVGNDIDDALALAVIHKLADRGEIELLAVTISKDNPYCAPYINLINTFYGRPDVPIGMIRGGKTPEDGEYIRAVVEKSINGRVTYPRNITSGAEVPEAIRLLRKILVSQPDNSVVIVSVGFLTNMARLVDSPSDEISPLKGIDLIKKKAPLYVMMAGAFSQPRKPEYNVYIDSSASQKVFDTWPTRIVASGYEVGDVIRYPAYSIEHDFRYVSNHPIPDSYRLYMKMPYDRQCWDLTAVLYAIRPEYGYFSLSYPGKISLNEKNITEFAESEAGRHRYLTVTPEQIIRVRETLVQLVSSPPNK
ncbi:MAG: nucleoside hydrolase [Patescibacteria group bacterium]|nr:nucleoside hydrolase [Patescibacteria group bacterium]